MKLQPLVSWWLLAPYLVAVVSFVVWQLWQARKHKKRLRTGLMIRRTSLLLLPVLIALGPSVQGGVSSPGVTNLDVVFVVDTTPSMGALDYNGTQQRIDGVKKDMLMIASSLQGAHFHIISFDTAASVILPSTTDATAFAAAVNGITPQVHSYSQGSTIDKAVSLMVQELKNSADAYPERYRLLYYMGDGEQTANTKAKSFDDGAEHLAGGAVLGYGTAKGAQMVKYTGFPGAASTKKEFITTIDEASNQLVPASSRTDSDALKKAATELKIPYQDRNQGGPVEELSQISRAALAIDRSQRVIHYLNLYWLAAIPYAALIFWEWQAVILKLFEMKDRPDQASRQPKSRSQIQGGRRDK